MEKKKQKNVRLNYKGIIAIMVIIAIIIAIVIFVIRKNKKNDEKQLPIDAAYTTEDNGTKVNTSTKLQEIKNFNGYEISNIELKETNGEAEFSAQIKNVTQSSIGNKSIYIVFKSQSEEELYKMQVYLGEIKPEKSTRINSKITKSVIDAYDIEIKF